MFPLIPHPQSMPWQDDPYGLLHRLFWNETPLDPDEGVFRNFGVVHLYATSGIHLYAFLQTMEVIAYPIARFFGLPLRATKRASIITGLVLLLWAWSLQSFRAGFARPLVTYLIRRWGAQYGARFRILAPLLGTLAMDLLCNFGGGRSHYYLAIAGGLLAMEQLEQKKREPGVMLTHLALSIGSWVLTAPLDLIAHHRIAWATPIYSLVTLPVLSQALYPATLLSLAVDGRVPTVLLDAWSGLMRAILWLADHLPGPLVVNSEGLWLGLGISLLILLTSARRRLQRAIITAAMMSLCLRPLLTDTAMLTQLNIGQGDALLIHTLARTEMIDAGPERGLCSSAWIDELQENGVADIDAILFSHLDADHVRGIARILPWAQMGCVQTHERHWDSEKGRELAQFLRAYAPNTRRETRDCFKSGSVDWFESHSPHADGNGLMAGVLIPLAPDKVYLALGDGDQEQEQNYWRRFGPEIAAYPHRIWKLGHHGSRYSSGENFLSELNPEKIWVSVGKRNPYHHPSAQTLQRLRALGDEQKIQRTDVAGDLTEKISQPSRLRILKNWERKKSSATGLSAARSF